jgi:NADH-ubiquinone oxidoreductase chain 6
MTNGFLFEILDLFFFICIFFGIYTIISKNPIVSVLFLIGLFVAIACYLIFIGIDFIGISYLLVYVGAVSILFLFILMLINIRVSELLSENNNYLPLSILSVLPFFFIIGKIFPSTNFKFQEFTQLYKNDEYFFQSKQDIFFVAGNI